MFPDIDKEQQMECKKFSVLLEQVHNQLLRNMQNVEYNGYDEKRLYIGDYERLVASFKVLESVFFGFKILTTHAPKLIEARFHNVLLGTACITGQHIQFYRRKNKAAAGNSYDIPYTETFEFFNIFEAVLRRYEYHKDSIANYNKALEKAITELI